MNGKTSIRSHIVHAIIAGIGVAIVAFFFQISIHTSFLLACMGSSAALIMLHPKKKSNSLRTVGLAYMTIFMVGYIIWLLAQKLGVSTSLYGPLSMFLVIVISFLIMVALDIFHAPAIGGALGFVLEGQDINELVLLFAAVVVMLYFLKFLQYMYKEELKLEHFILEFSKDHYKHENKK